MIMKSVLGCLSTATVFRCALAATVLAGPWPGRAAEVRFSEPQNAITIEGSIAEGDEAKFVALLARDPRAVIVQSEGGAQRPSLVIAREVHDRGMTVIVDGFCASACAQIIFAAAAERRIRPNSFVAFHAGNVPVLHAVSVALTRLSEEMKDLPDADARRATIQLAAQKSQREIAAVDGVQAAFEADMKLDPAVTEFYKRLTAPSQLKVDVQVGDDLNIDYQVRGTPSECDWWVPDREGLARLGLDLRNAYDVPPIAALAIATRSPARRLYVGPPMPVDEPSFATLCKPD